MPKIEIKLKKDLSNYKDWEKEHISKCNHCKAYANSQLNEEGEK